MTEKKISRWKPGQTGNPKGRPPGQSEITRLRASLAGDVQAARLILERILPPVKAVEQTVELQLPADGTLTAKASAVLSAAAAGELAPGQAAQLIAAPGTLAKINEVDELAARITSLEEKQNVKS